MADESCAPHRSLGAGIPGYVLIGAHEDCPAAADLPHRFPVSFPVAEVTALDQCANVSGRRCSDGLRPRLAVCAGNQRQLAACDEIENGHTPAVLYHPRMREARARPKTRDEVAHRVLAMRALATVGHQRSGFVTKAELQAEHVEVLLLIRDRGRDAGARRRGSEGRAKILS
jgi:hypothetical protein